VAALRAGFAAALALLAAGAPAQEAMPPGREVSLPPSQAKDTFFAYALGIIGSGAELEIDTEQMRTMFVEFTTALGVPFDLISRFSQHADPETDERRITLEFARDVVIPVPFSLLWYHPGSIIAARRVGFDVRRSSRPDPGEGADAAPPVEPVYDLAIADGSILVDIDDWLEVLFSASLEDAWIRNIVFFKWHRHWIGLLAGTGRSTQRVLRAYFDFTRNEILFPAPQSLDSAGRELVPDAPAPP
jgi:hypothetical protein